MADDFSPKAVDFKDKVMVMQHDGKPFLLYAVPRNFKMVHVLVPLGLLEDGQVTIKDLNAFAAKATGYHSLRVSQVGVLVAGSYTRMSEQEMRTATRSFSDAGWAFFLCTAGTNCFAGMLEDAPDLVESNRYPNATLAEVVVWGSATSQVLYRPASVKIIADSKGSNSRNASPGMEGVNDPQIQDLYQNHLPLNTSAGHAFMDELERMSEGAATISAETGVPVETIIKKHMETLKETHIKAFFDPEVEHQPRQDIDAVEDIDVDNLNVHQASTWLKRLGLRRFRLELLGSMRLRIKEALMTWDQRYTYEHIDVYVCIGGEWTLVDASVHYRMYRQHRHYQFMMKLANGGELGRIPCYFGKVFELMANGKTFEQAVREIIEGDQLTFLNNMRLARCDSEYVKLEVTGSIVNTMMQLFGDESIADYKQKRAAWTSICVPRAAFMHNGKIVKGGVANHGPALMLLFALYCLAFGSMPKGGVGTILKCLQQQVSEPGLRNVSLGSFTVICHGMNVSLTEMDEAAPAVDLAAQIKVWQENELFAAFYGAWCDCKSMPVALLRTRLLRADGPTAAAVEVLLSGQQGLAALQISDTKAVAADGFLRRMLENKEKPGGLEAASAAMKQVKAFLGTGTVDAAVGYNLMKMVLEAGQTEGGLEAASAAMKQVKTFLGTGTVDAAGGYNLVKMVLAAGQTPGGLKAASAAMKLTKNFLGSDTVAAAGGYNLVKMVLAAGQTPGGLEAAIDVMKQAKTFLGSDTVAATDGYNLVQMVLAAGQTQGGLEAAIDVMKQAKTFLGTGAIAAAGGYEFVKMVLEAGQTEGGLDAATAAMEQVKTFLGTGAVVKNGAIEFVKMLLEAGQTQGGLEAATAVMQRLKTFLGTGTIAAAGGYELVKLALAAEDKETFFGRLELTRAAAERRRKRQLTTSFHTGPQHAANLARAARERAGLDLKHLGAFARHLEKAGFWHLLDDALDDDDPEKAVQTLLALWPNAIQETHENGSNLLHRVLEKKARVAVVLKVLAGRPAAVAEKDADGNTPLHIALRFCLQFPATGAVVEALVKAGRAAIETENTDGRTPMQLALREITGLFRDAARNPDLNKRAMIIEGIGPLFQNRDLRAEVVGKHHKPLLVLVMTCAVNKSVSNDPHEDHWKLRDLAAAAVCTICASMGPSMQGAIAQNMMGALLDTTFKSLASHYGAIVILGGFGTSVVDTMLISLTGYAPFLTAAMADTADEKIRADATKVCGAILAVLNGYTQWKLQGKLPAVAQAWIDKSIDLFR